MDCNINFQGKLVVGGVAANNPRWRKIAQIVKEETKGINYESRVFETDGSLNVYVDRINRKNRKNIDCIDDFCSREANLTGQGTKELLSKPDNVVGKILAQHMKFVKNLDDSYKQADIMLDKAFEKVCNLFKKNGYDLEPVQEMFDVSTRDIAMGKVSQEYRALRKAPGFQDADISHVSY